MVSFSSVFFFLWSLEFWDCFSGWRFVFSDTRHAVILVFDYYFLDNVDDLITLDVLSSLLPH